ncbi:ZIP family metal transporter [Candidatus Woesearchaeota archaeon]|nr:ZIP family metal transporter [Candidatus Woesearchaeota archaeon]
MIEPLFFTLISVILISLVSFIGISAFFLKAFHSEELTHFFVSFAAGALLADVFIHILPEIVEETGFTLWISIALLLGILIFFILEKFLYWHHCHAQGNHAQCHPKPFAYMNLVADGLHNFIDGLVIGGSYLISAPVGVATTVAVIMHEIPQEIGDFAVLLKAGFSRKKALLFNFLSAVTAIFGGLLAILIGFQSTLFSAGILAVTAGCFMYIALADLIPELHKEPSHGKSTLHFFGILLGMAVMFLLLFFE